MKENGARNRCAAAACMGFIAISWRDGNPRRARRKVTTLRLIFVCAALPIYCATQQRNAYFKAKFSVTAWLALG
ncbi:MAG TPA: hypothetical protein VGM46_08620 [Mesorhizobium sp.]|jgi:hypothetical protein